jgi:integrase
LLSQAVEDERLPANPALRMGKYLRRGDVPEQPIQALTGAEVAHLVGIAERHFLRWYPWVLCALRTGLRLGELLALQWGDIDWNGRFVVVQRNIVRGLLTSPKFHQRRRVDITPQLATALLVWRRVQRTRWLKKGQSMPPWVFPSLEGTALEVRNVRHVFSRLLEKAELRQIRIHDLRHTYATLLLQAGAPITYVSQQLGHRDASITLRVYAHWLPDASRREADRLDTLQPPATPAQPEAVSDDQVIRAKSFGMNGDPNVRQLEPNRQMAPTRRGAPIVRLSARAFVDS